MALQRRIRTLAGVHPGRLAPSLTRFAVAAEPWTAAEVHAAIDRVLAARGWDWPSRPRWPAGYLARLLREIDHVDQLTGAARVGPAELERRRAAQRAEADELAGRDLCPHGVGGADPQHGGTARCAFCRRAGSDGQHK